MKSLKVDTSYQIIQNEAQTSSSGNWTERQKLHPFDQTDFFGASISFSGDTALLGAPGDNNYTGAVYVFTRSGTNWTQQQKLLASDGAGMDQFGISISLAGDTALIGTVGDDTYTGSAYIFTRTGTTWAQQAKLIAPDREPYDNYGSAVCLVDDTALIGSYGDDDNGTESGSAYVFTRTRTTWILQAKLLASDGAPHDLYGFSVSLSDDTALIGARGDDDNGDGSGSTYVLTRTGTSWAQHAKLIAPDGAPDDNFGYSISLDGDTAFIGAHADNENGNYSGSMYVFIRNGTSWTQQQKLLPSDGAAYDYFGQSVSLSGDTAFIGAHGDDDNGNFSGSVYVFTRIDTIWTQQQKLHASVSIPYQFFGRSVSLDGDTAIVGASYDTAYVFVKQSEAPHLEINLYGGIGVNADIRYIGTENSISVNWEIQVKGNILGLIHRNASGAIVIQNGESRWVSTGLFLGLGPFTIIARANDQEKTATGIIFLFYVIVLT